MKSHLKKFHARPLSWSSLSLWDYDRDAWCRKYLDGIVEPSNKEMECGKKIHALIGTIPTFLPAVPRYEKFEVKLEVKLGKINLIAFVDTLQEAPLAIIDFKTTSNTKKWTQDYVDSFGQLKLYKAMLWLLYDTDPAKIGSHIVVIPVRENGNFKMELDKSEDIRILEAKHTKIDILNFLVEVKNIYKQMEQVAKEYK